MAMIKCPTGWLVVPSDEAASGYVPFFIQVRDADIHWKEDPEFKSVITNITESGVDSINVLHPGSIYRIDRKGWSIDMQNDGLFTASTQISIDDMFEIIDVNNSILSSVIDLPLFVKNDKYFNIQITLSPADDDIQYATANIRTIETSAIIDNTTVSGYRSFRLNLNSFIYRFTESFVNDYKNSKIFITIRGYIPITNQPINDNNTSNDNNTDEGDG